MFAEVLADYVEWTASALHAEVERLELVSRDLDARRLAVRAAAESKQTPALDGHTSTQAYLRATTNQPAVVALAEVRRARLCRDFPQVGEHLGEHVRTLYEHTFDHNSMTRNSPTNLRWRRTYADDRPSRSSRRRARRRP